MHPIRSLLLPLLLVFSAFAHAQAVPAPTLAAKAWLLSVATPRARSDKRPIKRIFKLVCILLPRLLISNALI